MASLRSLFLLFFWVATALASSHRGEHRQADDDVSVAQLSESTRPTPALDYATITAAVTVAFVVTTSPAPTLTEPITSEYLSSLSGTTTTVQPPSDTASVWIDSSALLQPTPSTETASITPELLLGTSQSTTSTIQPPSETKSITPEFVLATTTFLTSAASTAVAAANTEGPTPLVLTALKKTGSSSAASGGGVKTTSKKVDGQTEPSSVPVSPQTGGAGKTKGRVWTVVVGAVLVGAAMV